MRTKIKSALTLIIILYSSSCKDQGSISDPLIELNKEPSAAISKAERLSLLDTTIVLADTKSAYMSNKNLTAKEAKALLYKYFKEKGITTRNELRDVSLNSTERLCVDYDTIYQLQTNKYSGAIVSYWLGPADLNGNCFQPSKAVILNTIEGYKITNEEFIPTNYIIDSVIKSNICGYDYECGGRGTIRYWKVTLK
ncbi:MAG: hypothetical protein ABIN97_11995 [Ginsengibacter sp.]